MNMLLRLVIVLSVVRVASLFIFWPIGAVVSIILPFPIFGVGISYIASIAVALVAGCMAWKKFDATEGSLNSNVVLGALIFGSAGVVFGDAWSLSINPRNEDAIFGVFVFGFSSVCSWRHSWVGCWKKKIQGLGRAVMGVSNSDTCGACDCRRTSPRI